MWYNLKHVRINRAISWNILEQVKHMGNTWDRPPTGAGFVPPLENNGIYLGYIYTYGDLLRIYFGYIYIYGYMVYS